MRSVSETTVWVAFHRKFIDSSKLQTESFSPLSLIAPSRLVSVLVCVVVLFRWVAWCCCCWALCSRELISPGFLFLGLHYQFNLLFVRCSVPFPGLSNWNGVRAKMWKQKKIWWNAGVLCWSTLQLDTRSPSYQFNLYMKRRQQQQ